MSALQPSISIIIPVFNHWEHLRTCVVSLQVQTYRPEEIIVVDDGSSVPLDAEMKQFLEGAKVRYIRIPHGGAPAARNAGLKEATGVFVFFCDADVEAKNTLFARLIEPLLNDETRSFSYCDFLFGDKEMKARPFDAVALLKRNYISSMALLRRSDAVLWDTTLHKFQDWDYWLTIIEKGKKGYYVPGVLFHITPRGEKGMSIWVPRWGYWWPFCLLPRFKKTVQTYKEARKGIWQKHLKK